MMKLIMKMMINTMIKKMKMLMMMKMMMMKMMMIGFPNNETEMSRCEIFVGDIFARRGCLRREANIEWGGKREETGRLRRATEPTNHLSTSSEAAVTTVVSLFAALG